MAMSLAAGATASGGTDSGVETGNESNDIDINLTGGLHGFDSLENDGVTIAVPPPPPTSPESANESHSHDESETEMTTLTRENFPDFSSDAINNISDMNGDDCVTDMDRDIDEDELEIANALTNSTNNFGNRNDKDANNGIHDQQNLPFSQAFAPKIHAFAVPACSPPPAPPATPTNLNTCKALMKFEFPELPKLTCQFVDPPAGIQSFISLQQFKVDNNKGYSVVNTQAEASLLRKDCTALMPYEQRDVLRRSSKIKRPRRQYMAGRKEYNERRLRLVAGYGNNLALLTKLLETTDVNACDELGRTALHIAACKGFSEVVRLLLQKGANPNKKDSVGNTPLHLAACTNHFDVVTCLLRAGTDVSTLDNHGRNPLQLAQSKLKLIASSKQQPTEDAIKIKMEVQQIIEMMLEYLQKKGQDVEAELLNAFASRLTLSQTPDEVDADVKSLLANLSSLTLSTPSGSNSMMNRCDNKVSNLNMALGSISSPLRTTYLRPSRFTPPPTELMTSHCPHPAASAADNAVNSLDIAASSAANNLCNDNSFTNSSTSSGDHCQLPFTFFK